MKHFLIPVFLQTMLSLTPLSAQEIALTFDDAPTHNGPVFSGDERTDRILDHLKRQSVKQVAFFVITANAHELGKDRLMKYTDAGHLLANHTHSHQWIHLLGTARYNADVKKADSILRSMQGFAPWFRYPFLDEGKSKPVRDSIRLALKDLGLSNGYVTIDNYDWYLNSLLRKAKQEGKKVNHEILRSVYLEHIWNSVQFYDSIARQTLGRSPRHVLLLHENDLTAYFLSDLIQLLREKGWKIISPTDAYKDPIATHIPDVLFNGQGRVGAIAREKGSAAKDLIQLSEDEAFLDELLRTRKVFE
jgi:peptidoglycan/xylan/chitin deacetylase (PgdA/CDA1 family)